MPKLMPSIEFLGKKFNRFTIIEDLGVIKVPGKKSRRFVNAMCDCGNIKELDLSLILANSTKSCGCLRKEKSAKVHQTHGLRGSRLYSVWNHIKERCLKSNEKSYKYYGGRGITISDEWKKDFKVFYDWALINGYSENLQIDRRDNNGNYEPGNCRFITRVQNMRNTRKNIFVTHNGEIKTLAEWAEQFNISYQTLHSRLKSGSTPPELFLPLLQYRK